MSRSDLKSLSSGQDRLPSKLNRSAFGADAFTSIELRSLTIS